MSPDPVTPPRLRIYQLITELEPAGAERVLYQITRGLDPERFEVRVGALRGGGSVGVWLRAAGFEVFEAGVPRSGGRWLRAPGGFVRLLRDLRRFRPHVLHTHLFHAGAAGRLAAPLATVSRIASHVHVVEGRNLPWRDRFDRWTSGLVDVEICVSQAVADDRRRSARIPPEKLRVVHNGVDVERARRTEVVTKMKATTRLFAGRPTIVAIGRLDRQKGLDVLVEAAAILSTELPELLVVILGEGPERPALESQIDRLGLGGAVRLDGHREDIGRYLAAADVAAVPSRWEGFGIAAVEAMAAGVPVVASDRGSLPEIISHDETGLLVPAEDPQALAREVRRLLADEELRARLGAAGARSVERFSIERMVQSCAELYESLCDGTGTVTS